MTIAAYVGRRIPVTWVLVCASTLLSGLLATTIGTAAFRAGVAGMALLAATCIAAGDVRTGKIRNAWTIPFAAAAILHLLIAMMLMSDASDLPVTVLLAASVNSGLYLAMALAGWVGFGDVKFVIGLTLVAVALVGRASMLIPFAALLISAVAHALSAHEQHQSSTRPHGPAIAAAFALILAGTWPT